VSRRHSIVRRRSRRAPQESSGSTDRQDHRHRIRRDRKDPRSNPATYVGVFRGARSVSRSCRRRGREATGRAFSFNVKGGRCEACQGDGLIRIEMHFSPMCTSPRHLQAGGTTGRDAHLYKPDVASTRMRLVQPARVLRETFLPCTGISSVSRLYRRALPGVAGDVHIGEEVHLDPDEAVSLAGLAPPALHVEGEPPGLVASRPRLRHEREQIAHRRKDADVGGGVRARGPSDRV